MDNRKFAQNPVLCNKGSGSIHHRFFGCPICGTEVGGFLSTGDGPDDWMTHQDKFCHECGQAIDWGNTDWLSLYW